MRRAFQRRAGTVAIAIVVTATALAWSGSAPSTARAGMPTGLHWIGTQLDRAGKPQLFDRRTGMRFVPRGVSLLKDEPQTSGPYPILDMIVAPGEYDDGWTRTEFHRLTGLGYNTVRVWLDHCPGDCLTNPDGSAKAAWLDNVAALLGAARDAGLVVMLVSNELPEVGYADHLPYGGVFDGGFDATILSPTGVDLTLAYWRMVIGGLQARGAPLDVVLGYELLNETFFELDRNPLAMTAGSVTAANGLTYDMGNQASRDALVDEGLVYWAGQASATIRAMDPGALVTIGFFPPMHDTRLVRSAYFAQHGDVDFIDAHSYPGMASYLADDLAAMGLLSFRAKPVLLGEYGAFRLAYPDPRAGAHALAATQAQSCSLGLDGWLTWVMGSLETDIIRVEDGHGEILRALSPKHRPDPCAPDPRPNLAFGAKVVVSALAPDSQGSWATDGLAQTGWSAGDYATQWIGIDLGAATTIHELRLLIGQYPAGHTRHLVEVRTPVGSWHVVHVFDGTTDDGQWLRWFPPSPLIGVRYLRVTTSDSPSWVGWREIQAY